MSGTAKPLNALLSVSICMTAMTGRGLQSDRQPSGTARTH